MRVINLLPWREALYQKRRRHFLSALFVLLSTSVLMALITYKQRTQARAAYDRDKTHLQTALDGLEQQNVLLQQQAHELLVAGEKLQAIKQQRRQQLEWQQRMQEWSMLAADAQISEIKWQGGELVITGATGNAPAEAGAAEGKTAALRQFLQSEGQWQLQQIELDVRNRYQFVVSRAVVLPVDL